MEKKDGSMKKRQKLQKSNKYCLQFQKKAQFYEIDIK